MWKMGIGHFFLDEVPFSVRNGPTYAKKCVAQFETLPAVTAERNGMHHVYELGAGLGL
jgi:hypothetical protein